jgi:hypothetical protein
MKSNVKMKALAVAVLGLAGFAGSAMALCPSDPAAPAGPWSSKSVTAGALAIVTPGEVATECRLKTNFNATSSIIAKSFVQDNTPANEPRYRARFYVDTTELTGLTTPLRSVQVFIVSGTSFSATTSMVRASLIGVGGVPTLRFIVSDTSQPGNARTIDAVLPAATGKNRVEIDLQTGAAGSFRHWVSTAAAATTDGAPTGNATGVNNAGWVGVDQIVLGLSNGSAQFRTAYGPANAVYFDEFDSRRQTFIGL